MISKHPFQLVWRSLIVVVLVLTLSACINITVVKRTTEPASLVKAEAVSAEVVQALEDLHAAGCDLITITQYLRPTNKHHPVERWVKPDEFVELAKEAEQIGFLGVMSGPLVRSSYRAGRLYKQAMEKKSSRG